MLEDQEDFYRILELTPEASPEDIRQAYLRLKLAFGKNSAATYSLLDAEDSAQTLRDIEKAYQTLSHKESRAAYDSDFLKAPMSEDDHRIEQETMEIFGEEEPLEEDLALGASPFDETAEEPSNDPIPEPKPAPRSEPIFSKPAPEPIEAPQSELEQAIEKEEDWRGSFLKWARELQQVSVEEMADFTKVSKTYIRAIEAEEFDKLPAPVFVRGFLFQIAKRLGLPADRVASTYVARVRLALEGKD